MITKSEGVCWGEVRRSVDQVIKVQLYEYQGRPFVRLECWDKALADTGSGVFTGKGYALNVKAWAELLPIIEAASQEALRRSREGR